MTDRIIREIRLPGWSKREVRQWRHRGRSEGEGGFRVRSQREQRADGTPGDTVIRISVREKNISSPRPIEE